MSDPLGRRALVDIRDAGRDYRALWAACVAAGLLGLATVAPLISALQVELEMAAGVANGAGVHDPARLATLPASARAIGILLAGLVCLSATGRTKSWRLVPGAIALVVGAGLVMADNWILVKDVWRPAQWDVATLYSTFEAGVWGVSALVGSVAIARLATSRAAEDGPSPLALMSAFHAIGGKLRRYHRTFRPVRLLLLLPALAISFGILVALQVLNARVFSQIILGVPPDLYRDPARNLAFVTAHPGIMLLSAAGDLVQVVLSVAGVAIVLRFFWRLIVMDARSLLADPDYKPIVFLRSFADDAAAVRSKRLLDRLVRRRRRLEEIAVSALAPLGVTIAIGQPGERLPKLGALRAYYADDSWQEAVLQWMERAQLIVLVAGSTRWTLWELAQALNRGHSQRLIVVVPPDLATMAAGTRLAALATAAAGSIWEASLGALAGTGACAVVLNADGSVSVIAGEKTQQADYEIALAAAAVKILHDAPEVIQTT